MCSQFPFVIAIAEPPPAPASPPHSTRYCICPLPMRRLARMANDSPASIRFMAPPKYLFTDCFKSSIECPLVGAPFPPPPPPLLLLLLVAVELVELRRLLLPGEPPRDFCGR